MVYSGTFLAANMIYLKVIVSCLKLFLVVFCHFSHWFSVTDPTRSIIFVLVILFWEVNETSIMAPTLCWSHLWEFLFRAYRIFWVWLSWVEALLCLRTPSIHHYKKKCRRNRKTSIYLPKIKKKCLYWISYNYFYQVFLCLLHHHQKEFIFWDCFF